MLALHRLIVLTKVTDLVVYSREEENGKYRIGAYFITMHPQDRVKLGECVKAHLA